MKLIHNNKIKSLAILTAAYTLSPNAARVEVAEHNRTHLDKKDTSFLRKKCKSCKVFLICGDYRHKWRKSPLAQACINYIPKKK